MSDPSDTLLQATCLATLPGALVWLSATRLTPSADPAEDARRLYEQRSAAALLGLAGAALALIPDRLGWLPALVSLAGAQAALYPVRRRMLGESLGFGAHLVSSARLLLASAGLWTLLLMTPGLVADAGGGWPVAAGLGALLVTWTLRAGPWARALLAAQPLDDAALAAAADQAARAAQTGQTGQAGQTGQTGQAAAPPVRLLVGGPRRARHVATLGLADRGRLEVVLPHTLVDGMPQRELAAEVAQAVARVTLAPAPLGPRATAATLALGVAAAALTPALAALAPGAVRQGVLAWVLLLGSGLAGAAWAWATRRVPAADAVAARVVGDAAVVAAAVVRRYALNYARVADDGVLAQLQGHAAIARRVRALRPARVTLVSTGLGPEVALALSDVPELVVPVRWRDADALLVFGREGLHLAARPPADGGSDQAAAPPTPIHPARSYRYAELGRVELLGAADGPPRLVLSSFAQGGVEVEVRAGDIVAVRAAIARARVGEHGELGDDARLLFIPLVFFVVGAALVFLWGAGSC